MAQARQLQQQQSRLQECRPSGPTALLPFHPPPSPELWWPGLPGDALPPVQLHAAHQQLALRSVAPAAPSRLRQNQPQRTSPAGAAAQPGLAKQLPLQHLLVSVSAPCLLSSRLMCRTAAELACACSRTLCKPASEHCLGAETMPACRISPRPRLLQMARCNSSWADSAGRTPQGTPAGPGTPLRRSLRPHLP